MSLKVIDIIFIVIILIMGFAGLKKGFFSQVITISGILLGLFLAYFFSDDLAPVIGNIIGEHDSNTLISFILIFVVMILLSMATKKILSKTLNELGAGGIDKILGLSFGFIQGLIICIGVTALLVVQPFFNPDSIFLDSIIGSRLLLVLPQIENLIPSTGEVLKSVGTDV